jgi:hypothetical protein
MPEFFERAARIANIDAFLKWLLIGPDVVKRFKH